jgi:dTDP-4-dehydrorhamnose 3,5-epimerase
VADSSIDGVTWGTIARHSDHRGTFRELWREASFPAIDPLAAGSLGAPRPRFVQANLSTSSPGTLRGLHVHRRQLDHWIVASGRAFVALVDLRPALAGGDGRPAIETRTLVADDTVTIPAGVAHGFLALEPLELVYFVTNAYDGSDELGVAWDDPRIGVVWPTSAATVDGRPILSERDRQNPTLAELVARLQP